MTALNDTRKAYLLSAVFHPKVFPNFNTQPPNRCMEQGLDRRETGCKSFARALSFLCLSRLRAHNGGIPSMGATTSTWARTHRYRAFGGVRHPMVARQTSQKQRRRCFGSVGRFLSSRDCLQNVRAPPRWCARMRQKFRLVGYAFMYNFSILELIFNSFQRKP